MELECTEKCEVAILQNSKHENISMQVHATYKKFGTSAS